MRSEYGLCGALALESGTIPCVRCVCNREFQKWSTTSGWLACRVLKIEDGTGMGIRSFRAINPRFLLSRPNRLSEVAMDLLYGLSRHHTAFLSTREHCALNIIPKTIIERASPVAFTKR